MPRRRSSAPAADNPLAELLNDPSPRPRRRRGGGRRWLTWLAGFGILSGAFVVFLPQLISWGPVRQTLLRWALPDFPGTLELQNVSLAWWQPPRLQGVTLRDRDGQVLAKVAEVQGDYWLSHYLWDRSSAGTWTLKQPELQIVTRPQGSNWEDLLSAWPRGSSSDQSSGGEVPPFKVQIREGLISLASASDPQAWQLARLTADFAGGQGAALSGQLSTQVQRGEVVGNLSLTATVDENATPWSLSNAVCQLQAEQSSIGVLAPVLERWLGATQLAGNLSGEVRVHLEGAGRSVIVEVPQLVLTDTSLRNAQWLGGDHLQLSKLLTSGQLALNVNGIRTDKFQVDSDVGRLFSDGAWEWQQFRNLNDPSQLAQSPFQLDGQLDLAQLTQRLPGTFHLYDDLQVQSGKIRCQINSRPENQAGRVVLNVDTENLVAVRQGQRMAWQQPLRLVSTLTQRSGSWELDEVRCDSDFLTLQGTASRERGQFVCQGDLGILAQRLSQFIDLGEGSLRGKLAGEFGWTLPTLAANAANNPRGERPWTMQGQFTIDEPLVSLPGLTPWHEPQVKLQLQGAGGLSTATAPQLQTAEFGAEIGGERLQVVLAAPWTNIYDPENLQARFELSGQLSRWLAHLRPWIDLSFLKTQGLAQVQGLATWQSNRVLVNDLTYAIQQWEFDGYGMAIREDAVNGAGRLDFDVTTGLLTVPEATLVCSSVAALTDQLLVQTSPELGIRGQIRFRADSHRVLNWWGMFAAPDSVHYFGGVEGELGLASQPSGIQGQLQATITDFVAAQPQPQANGQMNWAELLREPQVNVQGALTLTPDFDQLTVNPLTVTAAAVQLTTQGSIRDLTGTMITDLQGIWNPDWQRVQKLLEVYTSGLVQLAGRKDQQFQIRGPLLSANPQQPWPPADLSIVTQVGWDQGVVMMLPVGSANITAGVTQGVALVDTGKIPFSGGEVSLAPEYKLWSADGELTLASGPIATNITLTPEICRDWLKFVTPLIADVTAAQGKIQVESGGFRVPVANLQAASGSGTLTLSDVTVGPGPLGMKLIESIDLVKGLLNPTATPSSQDRSVWMRLQPQVIPVRVAEGRIFHEQMTLQIKDVAVQTRGSVGFDQSLSLVAEIPIADDWIKGEAWMGALKGQTIKIPITGTVTKPQLDIQAVRELSMNLIQRTAANRLTGVVNEQTEKLQSKVGSELNKVQNKFEGELNKVQSNVSEKLQGEVFRGLNNLFGPKKDKE